MHNPLYISNQGGTINCFKGDTGWLFRVCSNHLSIYCNDLVSAKAQLDRLERRRTTAGNIIQAVTKKSSNTLQKLIEAAAAPYIIKKETYNKF